MQGTLWAGEPFISFLLQAAGVGTTFLVPPVNGETGLVGSTCSMHREADHSLYVPPTVRSAPPLVVMLHGGGQDPEDFASSTGMNAVAARHGFVVLYPKQPKHANPARCWNWFDAAHQTREQGEPARLVDLTLETARRCHADPARIYVAGLSAGGAMAALLGELFPDVFSAVGVHSGVAARAASDLGSALRAMRNGGAGPGAFSGMPTIVFHGDKDETVSPANALHVIEASLGADHPYEVSEPAGPWGRGVTLHRYSREGQAARAELWTLHGVAHCWSGRSTAGSFTDPTRPDASEEMWRFFDEHRRTQ